jgi:molecular chaperone Hsp33
MLLSTKKFRALRSNGYLSRYFSTVFNNYVFNSLSREGGVHVKVVDVTKLINEACKNHGCSPLASVALGRALAGNILLAHGRDENESYQIQINGNGVLGRITSECVTQDNKICVKGFVQNPQAELPLTDHGILDVSRGVGIGILQVHRSHPSWKEPFSGSVMLETSEIAEDLAMYLYSSEQTKSALWLYVDADHEGAVACGVGYLCSLLPQCSDDEVDILERNIQSMPALIQSVEKGKILPGDIANRLTQDLGEQFRKCEEVVLKCSCSREKYLRGIQSLGHMEVQDIVDKGEAVTVRCDWCSTAMDISCDEVKLLL